MSTESSKQEPSPTKVQYDHRVRLNRMTLQADLAQRLAPAFRDKYDFSSPEDFKNWAELCHRAADALITKGSSLLADESARFQKEQEDEAKKEAGK